VADLMQRPSNVGHAQKKKTKTGQLRKGQGKNPKKKKKKKKKKKEHTGPTKAQTFAKGRNGVTAAGDTSTRRGKRKRGVRSPPQY